MTMHNAIKIHKRIGFSFHIEFDSGEKRWVDVSKLVENNQKFVIYKRNPKLLDGCIIDQGHLEFSRGLKITGSTLYHMGQVVIPAEENS